MSTAWVAAAEVALTHSRRHSRQEPVLKYPATVSNQAFFELTAKLRPAVQEGEDVGFNQIIDVRSPAEFAHDHLPGAISCPVLSNEERIQVGTLYKQVSPFEAKKLGAALVSRNIAEHLEKLFRHHDKTWRPLIYCWRGGSRSGAMTHILREIGWKAAQLEGGYKAYRRHVVEDLETLPRQFRFVVIAGETGSAKSRLLNCLASKGAQVLDLENLACHKGSVLGVLPDQPQPSQKMFESLVWDGLRRLDPNQPVFIEAESKMVGTVRLPGALFECMAGQGQLVRLEVPVGARAEFLLQDYAYFLNNPEALKNRLKLLVNLHGHAVIQQWCKWADEGHWHELVLSLLTDHYDLAYRKSMRSTYPQLESAIVLAGDTLGEATVDAWASELLKRVNSA